MNDQQPFPQRALVDMLDACVLCGILLQDEAGQPSCDVFLLAAVPQSMNPLAMQWSAKDVA